MRSSWIGEYQDVFPYVLASENDRQRNVSSSSALHTAEREKIYGELRAHATIRKTHVTPRGGKAAAEFVQRVSHTICVGTS